MRTAKSAMTTTTQQTVYTVTQLNQQARQLLESNFQSLWISGEISNLSCPASGHLYFTLKDENAQVRCAFFKFNRMKLKFQVEHGQKVIVFAKVSLYERRGDYQLIVSQLELAGSGALQVAFEKLKTKLNQEGLFNKDHKKPIPKLPQCIGVITSPTGAAIRDILKILKRRFASIPVIIYPSLVQGDLAATQIVKAIKLANQRKDCDVLIVGRGGGSLEDLWAFNEEIVARAIFASDIPIVSAVGHEIDTTISDYVADERAATPSAAAELVSPNTSDLMNQLNTFSHRLIYSTKNQLKQQQLTIDSLQKQLQHPKNRLQQQTQQLDMSSQRLQHLLRESVAQKFNRLIQLKSNIEKLNPMSAIQLKESKISSYQQQLEQSMQHYLQQKQHYIKNRASELNTISPLNTLKRGYSIVIQTNGKVITDSKNVNIGDEITTRLAKGILKSIVKGC